MAKLPNQTRITSATDEKRPENTAVDRQAVAPDQTQQTAPSEPTGDGTEAEVQESEEAPKVSKAGSPIGEAQGGGLKLTNRGSDSLRVTQETKGGDGSWSKGSHVTLVQNDTTEFEVTEDRRVVIESV